MWKRASSILKLIFISTARDKTRGQFCGQRAGEQAVNEAASGKQEAGGREYLKQPISILKSSPGPGNARVRKGEWSSPEQPLARVAASDSFWVRRN
ncbi:hypothetical protein BJ170DRAFT_683550 [Xylariales sp. AK1849]|nr:hypothetical protein BJ170DRAFT_683550 [Xylariales sp. AK1849]